MKKTELIALIEKEIEAQEAMIAKGRPASSRMPLIERAKNLKERALILSDEIVSKRGLGDKTMDSVERTIVWCENN